MWGDFFHCGQRKVSHFLLLFHNARVSSKLFKSTRKYRPEAQHTCLWVAKVLSPIDNVCMYEWVCVFKLCWKITGHWFLGSLGSFSIASLEVCALFSQDCVKCLNGKRWCWQAIWLCYSVTFDEPVVYY